MKIVFSHTKRFISFLTNTTRGSNKISYWLRKKIERLPVRQILGLNLAGAAFFSVVVLPGAGDVFADLKVIKDTQITQVVTVPSSSEEFQWPLTNFGVSQRFSAYHPGVDLTADYKTPVHPISDGWVVWTNSLPWGYGNHILLAHNNNVNSLYAHLSKIEVKPGETVTKSTEIGQIGATGWATGNHLHLEIYQNGTNVDPFEVLPDLNLPK